MGPRCLPRVPSPSPWTCCVSLGTSLGSFPRTPIAPSPCRTVPCRTGASAPWTAQGRRPDHPPRSGTSPPQRQAVERGNRCVGDSSCPSLTRDPGQAPPLPGARHPVSSSALREHKAYGDGLGPTHRKSVPVERGLGLFGVSAWVLFSAGHLEGQDMFPRRIQKQNRLDALRPSSEARAPVPGPVSRARLPSPAWGTCHADGLPSRATSALRVHDSKTT